MGHLATFESITLHITTDQSTTHFTVETMFPGVVNYGFNETSPGLYSRNETAHNGSVTEIILPFGKNGGPNIAVLNDGSSSETERRKGLFIEAEAGHELTVYATGIEAPFPAIGTYMHIAIACAEFAIAKYQYFVFTLKSTNNDKKILITPCEDSTTVSVRPSQVLSHPDWVNPSHALTDPTSTSGQDVSEYGRLFNRFDTLMLSSREDLTGSIIISDKPLSVLVRSRSRHVTQIPPHPTYGDLFVLPNFNELPSLSLVIHAIGALTDRVKLYFSCNCTSRNSSFNEVGIDNFTATVNRGQYALCYLPTGFNMCIVESSQPVIVMSQAHRPYYYGARDYIFYLPSSYSLLIDSSVNIPRNVIPNVISSDIYMYLFWLEINQSDENGARCSGFARTGSHSDWIYFCSQYHFLTRSNIVINFENTRSFGGAVASTLSGLQLPFSQFWPSYSLPFKMDPVGCKSIVYT